LLQAVIASNKLKAHMPNIFFFIISAPEEWLL